ncbi:hypothetical protein E4U30_005868 [Claviceps sp. LM220 group G6]|nr:hypothetical protein E4U30_005868 [Claviceps sp. LM220 group G6]
MRSSLVLFGLAAFALAELNQNANEMRQRDVQDVEGSKVEADAPSKVLARAVTCCSNYPNSNVCQCWSDH